MYDKTKPELDDRDIVKVADYIVHEGWDTKTLVNGEKSQNLIFFNPEF